MDNKPEIVTKDDTITMKFKRPPTQEEFDHWAGVLAKAVEFANKKTGANIHIIGWEQKES